MWQKAEKSPASGATFTAAGSSLTPPIPATASSTSSPYHPLGLTDKEIRRLKRVDLLEMLVEQGREVERLKRELADARAQLEDRRIALEQSGSIAEAALKLNHVFEAAQAAADQYVQNVKMAAGGGCSQNTPAATQAIPPSIPPASSSGRPGAQPVIRQEPAPGRHWAGGA